MIKKENFSVILVFILLTIPVIGFSRAPATGAKGVYSGRSSGRDLIIVNSSGGDHPRIQWAIDNASEGDTVYVEAGTYYENLTIIKTINLTGAGPEYTTINGSGTGNVIDVRAVGVRISNFNITGSGSTGLDSGIRIQGKNNTIRECALLDNRNGISLLSANYNIIKNNIIKTRGGHGIHLDSSSNNSIGNNRITARSILPAPPVKIHRVLYDGELGGTPGSQNFTYVTFPFSSSVNESVSGNKTILDTTAARGDYAGYFNNPGDIPALDRGAGFAVNFTVRIDTEAHSGSDRNNDGIDDRSGFSVIVISSDLAAVELGFWENEIWIQEGGNDVPPNGDLFTHAEGAAYNTTEALVDYCLEIFNDSYSLSADGVPVLNGTLRDYTAFSGPMDPYETANLIFLGDDTTSSSARVEISRVSLTASMVNDAQIVGSGILLDRSQDNLLAKNILPDNGDAGITIRRSRRNQIMENRFVNNTGHAVNITDAESSENRIYHNEFENNNGTGDQAADYGTSNHWDDVISMGNHWSDLLVPDENDDGIIDHPHIVHGMGGAMDNHPLLKPFNDYFIRADAGSDISVNVGEPLYLNGTGSTGYPPVTNFTWSFTHNFTPALLHGKTPVFAFSLPGLYNITLLVANALNMTDNDTIGVTVMDVTPPMAVAGPNITMEQFQTVVFNSSGSSDNVAIVNFTWNFTYENSTIRLYAANPAFTFDIPGRYIITLTVTDSSGNAANDTLVLTVLPVRPDNFVLVDAAGGGDFLSIREGIDNVTEGGTVRVKEGHYRENIVINKTIDLVGAGMDNTTIDGMWLGEGVRVNANRTNISGFRVINSSYGIVLGSNHSAVRDCNSTGNVIGIVLGRAGYNTISGFRGDHNYGAGLYMTDSYMNIISQSTFDRNGEVGISLYYSGANLFTHGSGSANDGYGFYAYWLSNGNQMDNFTLQGNNKSGIYLFDSYYYTIENCNSSHNGGDGFYLMTSGSGITDCISLNNGGKGFNLYHTDTTAIRNCTIMGNAEEGISLKYSSDNVITGNLIINNERGIKAVLKSNSNLFHSNIFIYNFARVQAYDDGLNFWNTTQKGNYWSDLTGPDEDGDGIVDLPYEIDGDAGARDHFPLVELPAAHIPPYVEFVPPPEIITEPDSDGDGWNDSCENSSGSNPYDNRSTPWDWDGDGIDNDLDEYPNDASRWVREEADPDIILITLVIVFILFLVVIVCLSLMKKTSEPDEETRLRVIACIRKRPGAHYRDIKTRLGISGRTLSYHLEHLAAERIIASKKTGEEKRWFEVSKDDRE